MDKKSAAMWQYRWKDEVIAAGLLLAAGFLINAGIQIKGLFMDRSEERRVGKECG